MSKLPVKRETPVAPNRDGHASRRSNGSRHAVVSIIALILLAALVVAVNQSDRFEQDKARVRDRSVSASMLDYGEMGKILKHLGLVYGVREARLPPAAQPGGRELREELFKRKRKASDYAYLANPGNVYQMPSTAIIGRDSFRPGWPLISVVIDRPALTDADIGIVANPTERGKEWERRATASYFEYDELRFATNIGVRIHGRKRDREIRTNVLNQSYRLYFRNLYGTRSLSPGTVFDVGWGVRRLIVRRERLFAVELAFDIARRLGAITPEYKPAIFYLNGKRVGIRTLSEQLSEPQWETRLGHEDFYFFKNKGETKTDSIQGYREVGRWFRRHRSVIGLEMAAQRIDVRNLTRSLFAVMFCGANDWYQGAAVLDRRDPEARWYWVLWDMDESFRDNWLTSKGSLWEQDALAQVVIGDRKTGYWRATYGNFQSLLFERLMNNDPRYRDYFLRTVTDALNHELTPAFFGERFSHYDMLIEQYQDPIHRKDLEQYEQMKEFAKYRSDFVRTSLQRRFGETRFRLGEVYTVVFDNPDPGAEYIIDGYKVKGSYSGKYFRGQRIEIKRTGEADGHLWSVNGEVVPGIVLDLPVEADMTIGITR